MFTFRQFAKQSPELFGIALKIAAGIFFAMMFGIIKYLTDSIPLGQLVFFRSALALVPLVIFLLLTSDFPAGLKTQHPWKHVTRCLLGTLAMFFAFAALHYLPIAETTALNYLSPIMVVILAGIFLKESVNSRRWLGVFCGFLGLVMLTVPQFSAHTDSRTLIGIGMGLMSALLIAAALLQVRQLSKMGENAGAIAFYFALTSTVLGAVAMVGNWATPNATEWLCLIAVGLVGGVAQILMTLAYRYAEASAMAPYDYLSIVWAVIIGLLAFGEMPSIIFWFAMPLILLGAIIAKPKAK